MFRIARMEFADLVGEAGLCISWIPNGLLVEMAQNKLDTLRIQYEQQISSLQRQLEAERRNNQEQMEQRQQEYAQLVSDLRNNLDEKQQEKLDEVLSELTKAQTAEIEDLHTKYQHESSMELAALKLSMEQIYISKLQLEMSDLKLRYDQRMDALNKQHKEDINRLTARSSNNDSSVNDSTALTEHYNQLIQRISTELESMFPADQSWTNSAQSGDDDAVNGENDHQVPSLLTSHDVRNLLLSQQEKITSLRSKLLSEYETSLRYRTEVMENESSEVSNLEEQIRDLQKQYDEQLTTIQQKLHRKDNEPSQQSDVQNEIFEQQSERVQDKEAAFETNLNSDFIREKSEEQMSSLIHANQSEINSGELVEANPDGEDISGPSSEHRDYIHKTMAITAVSDLELDAADTVRSSQVDLSVRLKDLEAALIDKDALLKMLMIKLEKEELRSFSLDKEVTELQQKLEELQQQAVEALSQCSHLQELLLEKDVVIDKLNHEKRESEKLYRDLLEKESPSTKLTSSRENFPGSSVDDSSETPDVLHHSGVYKPLIDIFDGDNRNDDACGLDNSISGENISFDYTAGNANSNNNNSNSSAALEDLVDSLKKQVKELDQQIMEAKERETELQNQIEESEHIHKDMIETLKHELEHEKQIEVETMQSEFRIQLEIELKRQAAELLTLQSSELKSALQVKEINPVENLYQDEKPSPVPESHLPSQEPLSSVEPGSRPISQETYSTELERPLVTQETLSPEADSYLTSQETLSMEAESHVTSQETLSMEAESHVTSQETLSAEAHVTPQETLSTEAHVTPQETLYTEPESHLKDEADSPQSVSSNVFPMQLSTQTPSESFLMSELVANSDNDSYSSQEVSEFYLQQATLTEALASSSSLDTAKLTPGGIITKNLDHQPKSTLSALPNSVSDPESSTVTTNTVSLADMEDEIEKVENECQMKIAKLQQELALAEDERAALILSHQREIENIRKLLDEAEEKYDNLLEGVQRGEHQEITQLLREKYDEELEVAKSVMQKEYDNTLTEERKKFVERHRQLMGEFMEDREKEENEVRDNHTKELTELRHNLTEEFEKVLKSHEQEIEKLTHDLNELRNEEQGSNEELAATADRTLPEIDEITFSFQEMDVNSESPDSPECLEAVSTSVKRLYADDTGVQHDNTDAEEGTHIIPTLQIRNFADVEKTPPPLNSRERKDFEFTIQQLVVQVQRLTQQLSEAQRREYLSTQSSDTHSLNDAQKGDDSALIDMLKSDLDRISAERESVLRTNDRLLSLLSESVKTYVGVEDTINRKLNQVVSNTQSSSGHHSDDAPSDLRQDSGDASSKHDPQGAEGFATGDSYTLKGASPDGDTSRDSYTMENTSILSSATDEGLEISQRLAESIFVGPDLDAEGEEILTDARGRLQSAVGQLLDLMGRSTIQLMEAKATQQDLLDTLASRAQETEAANSKCSDLGTQLAAEIEAKEYLGLELHKAEGLISGYCSERENFESQIQSLDEQRERLIVELDTTRSLLQELQQSQSDVDSSREELSHQQQLLRQNVGQEMQAKSQQESSSPADGPPALLGEITNLSQDKKELSNQLQYQIVQARKQLTDQEAATEESERRHEAVIEERNRALEDLRLQLENVERQLKASKAFVEEQMSEREQEREEHQREVERLEQMIEGKDKNANSQQRLQIEVADLTEQLQARISSQSDMHQRTLELQKALEEKDLNTADLKAWVSQLESELDQRGIVEEQLNQRISRLEKQLTNKSDESDVTEDTDAISSVSKGDDASSSVQLSPARQSRSLSPISLKEELLRFQRLEEELQHENSALKEQVQQQLLQISGLRNQLDQLRNYGGDDEDSATDWLRLKLQTERDTVEKIEEKLSDSQNKIESLEYTLKCKDEEAEMVRMKVSRIIEMGDAQEENKSLKSQLEELQSQISNLSSVSSLHILPPELLEEKNHEIEELQYKLQLVKEKLSQKEEEETQSKSTIYELQSRLKEKDEEIGDLQDSITSLRRGEPCLDVSLPLNEETGNMLNISMTGRTTRSAMAVASTSIQQELEESIAERERDLSSLQRELEQARKDVEERDQSLKSLREMLDAVNKEKEMSQADNETVSHLEETIHQKDRELYNLTLNNEELKHQVEELVNARDDVEKHLESKETELAEIAEDRDKSLEQLHEKEDKLDQMVLQIDSLQQEISSLTLFQHELQKDFDTVQNMLDEKERDIENLTKELTDSKVHPDTLHTVLQLEMMVASLRKDLLEKQYVVDEKEEELYELHDKIEEMGNANEKLASTEANLTELKEQLHKEQLLNLELKELLSKEKAGSVESEKLRSIEENVEGEEMSMNAEHDEEDNHNKYQEDKIESLEKELQELKMKAEADAKMWAEMMEKAQEEHDKKLQAMEEQLQIHSANYLTTQKDSEPKSFEAGDNESVALPVEERDSVVQQLQAQLKDAISDSEQVIDSLKAQLDSRNRELEELTNVKQQLEETEEQLRQRQTTLLELQADKDQLLVEVREVSELKLQLEEKDKSLVELEGLMRSRQSSILELTDEKERILEDGNQTEVDLKQQLQDKEKMLLDMQTKYDELKRGINEEVLQMEQDIHRSSQVQQIKKSESEKEVEELRWKLLQASDELVEITGKQKQGEEKLSQICQQLIEREEQIVQLQSEFQSLQVEKGQPNVMSSDAKTKIDELESQLKDANEKTNIEAAAVAESREVINKLEKELDSVKDNDVSRQEILTSSSSSMSASLPLQEPMFISERSGMSRWDSEPISLARNLVDNTYIHYNIAEVERISRQQKREMSEKNRELDRVRQDLEAWLRMRGHDSQQSHQLIIQEKETRILTYQTEIETIRTVLEEKEQTIASLKDQLGLIRASHIEELSSQDHLITELQQQIDYLKSRTEDGASSPPPSKSSLLQGESLSPETKQSISHLKMQLRKAHAALEEMQQNQTDENEAGDGGDAGRLHKTSLEIELKELRQVLQHREEELSNLKAKFDKEIETRVIELKAQHDRDLGQLKENQERKLQQILTDQKQSLEKQHKVELNELKLQHQTESHGFRETQDQLTQDHNSTDDQYSLFPINGDEMMPDRLQTLISHLNQLGEHLLSVSDLHYLQQHIATSRQKDNSDRTDWAEERKSLMDTIEALKDLLKKKDQVVKLNTDDRSDWRAALLYSLVAVYENEKNFLQAEAQAANSMYPELNIMAQIEVKIHNLEHNHQFGLDEMLRADRQSLINEIDSLHHRLLRAHSQLEENQDKIKQDITRVEEAKTSGEWKLKRQIQMLEYKLQQEGVVLEDLKNSFKIERQRVCELSSQSSQERSKILAIQSELSSTQINLSKVRDALEREQQRFSSVTDALEEERSKTIRLTELLDSAKRKLHSLTEEVTQADVRHQQKVHSEEGYIKELQTELKKERQRCVQFIEAEQQAKREITHLSDENDGLKRKLSTLQDEYKMEIETLHREQMTKKLQAQLEDNPETVAKLAELLETERDSHNESVEHEKSIVRQLRREVDQLKSESIQLRHVYESEKSRADTLKTELDHARSDLTEERRGGNADSKQVSSFRHIKIVEHDREELTVRVNEALSSPEQVGKLQEHNQQLNEQIVKLKKEKETLSDSLKTLEQRLQLTIKTSSHTQVNIPQYMSDTASEEDSVYDRSVWAGERLGLQMALDSAEHEIQRLRSEIHHFKTLINSNNQQSHTDPDKTSRLYGKYLRAESFRKALIYQKKYLLLLLGGYRDTEQETLAILASMGGFPSSQVSTQHSRRNHTKAFTVFRSVGRMVVAIFRMKYLVKRWKRATRIGSPVVTGQINHQHAYIPSSSSFPNHQRHHQEPSVRPVQPSTNNIYTTNNHSSSSSSADYISSLSNDRVSTLASTAHQGAATRPRPQSYTTPPTKELVRQHKSTARGNREDARLRIFQDEVTTTSIHTSARNQRVENDDDNFLQYLENVQQELSDSNYGSPLTPRHVAWR